MIIVSKSSAPHFTTLPDVNVAIIVDNAFSLNLSEKEMNAVWNFSSYGDLSQPWTTLIRMKSDLIAGRRFIDSIKSLNKSCSGSIGRIFDRGVVYKKIATLLIIKLSNVSVLLKDLLNLQPKLHVLLKYLFSETCEFRRIWLPVSCKGLLKVFLVNTTYVIVWILICTDPLLKHPPKK